MRTSTAVRRKTTHASGTGPALVFADASGSVLDSPGTAAAARCGRTIVPIDPAALIPLPRGSELYLLPERDPIGFDAAREQPRVIGDCRAVAAFLPPGYVVCALAAYERQPQAAPLPLFTYAATCWLRGKFHVPAVRVEHDVKHDPSQFSERTLAAHVRRLTTRRPKNRLVRHLAENCAVKYGCANARNLFYGRWECPIPVASVCNAACIGCISAQPDAPISPPQDRLTFQPSVAEAIEFAAPHLKSAPLAMVSFGQGCEGEPLVQGELIAEIIRAIRRRTDRGTIHLNTNGSRPDVVAKLCDAGLDSIRVSLNSARSAVYTRYYRPRNYSFNQVVDSIRVARARGLFTSINYLSFPGVTDSAAEVDALEDLIRRPGLDMIQWRNLNIDPDVYLDAIALDADEPAIGMRRLLERLRRLFPSVRHGYVNPPRESWT
jgi:wyosine [tRNA(Phe)-imidazoG37] synthetase (radical SAM superfamily)